MSRNLTREEQRVFAKSLRASVHIVSDWQPIETAPKDGTAILGFIPSRGGYVADQRVANLHWTNWGNGEWEFTNSGHKCFDPVTHWQPLPIPPQPA